MLHNDAGIRAAAASDTGTTVASMASLDVTAPPVPRSEEILTPEALAFVADLDAQVPRATRRAAGRRGTRAGRRSPAPAPSTSCPRPPRSATATGPSPDPRGPARPARGDHRPDRRQDGDQRAQLRRPGLARRPRGRQHPALAQRPRRADHAVRRGATPAQPSPRRRARPTPSPIPSNLPVIVPRPRGWHFDEEHVTADGRPVVAALFDFGLYFFHNAREQLSRGSGAYFYLPKMESHLEARLWNDVFTHAEAALGRADRLDPRDRPDRDHHGRLRDGRDPLRAARAHGRPQRRTLGLPLQHHQELPRRRPGLHPPRPRRRDHDRADDEGLQRPARAHLPPARCVRDRRHGGLHPEPRRTPRPTSVAFAKVREDKTREVTAGFDGSWVAHPDLVPLCAEIFSEALGDRSNQLDVLRDEVDVSAADLLAVDRTPGDRTEAGLRGNVRIGIQYLQAWLSGNGAAGIDNLMEDAATAEISRSQVWQWINNAATLDTGEVDHPRAGRADRRGGVRRGDRRSGDVRRRSPGRRATTVRRVRPQRGLPGLPHPAGVPRHPRRRELSARRKPPEAICTPPTHTSATSASLASANTLPSASSGEPACRSPMSSAVPAGGRRQIASNSLPSREVADDVGESQGRRAGRGAQVQEVRRASAGSPASPRRRWTK